MLLRADKAPRRKLPFFMPALAILKPGEKKRIKSNFSFLNLWRVTCKCRPAAFLAGSKKLQFSFLSKDFSFFSSAAGFPACQNTKQAAKLQRASNLKTDTCSSKMKSNNLEKKKNQLEHSGRQTQEECKMSGHALHKFANGKRTSGRHLPESIL